jgi:hypothetical protein
MKQTLKRFALAAVVIVVGATTVVAGRVAFVDTPADAARPDRMSDPVEDNVRKEILAKAPEQHQKPAPFLSLSIPDPLEIPKTIGLREQPADTEAPVATIPARPVLGAPAK